MADDLKIVWAGQTYLGSSLTAADMIAMEDEFGMPFGQVIAEGTMKATCWIVWLLRRHDDPALTFEDVTNITLGQLEADADQSEEVAVPPTNGSSEPGPESEPSGNPPTPVSTASAPGSSTA